MKTLTRFLYAATVLLFASCASGPRPGLPAPKIEPTASVALDPKKTEWTSMADVREALEGKGRIEIRGKQVDLKGAQLVGTKLRKYSDPQDERNQPLKIAIDGFSLVNGSTRSIPGGIVFRGDGLTFADMVFLKVGEDALSNLVDVSPNATVKRCAGYGATDKIFQFNDARGLTFSGNLVTGGITGVRIQKKDSRNRNMRTREIRGNRFVDVDTGFNVAGDIVARGENNTYEDVKTKWLTNNGASYSEN